MPGLRFKKRAARRHTIDNLDQNAKDIEAAKVEQVQKKKENEKFLQLFKSKYPNHAKDVNLTVDDVKDNKHHVNGHVASGEERNKAVSPTTGRLLCSPVKRSNSLSNKNNDHLFLRYHGEMRRTEMPKILTMAGLKKMFIDAFNLDRSVTHWPDSVLYIQDRYTDQWSELQDPGQAVESGVLLLRDLNQSGLPLLNNNTALDTDSTDASTTQSPLALHSHQANNLPRKPHKYESIDDFSKPNTRRSSSSVSRDATPPMTTSGHLQPSSTSTPKLPETRRISNTSAMAELKINELTTHIVSGGRHLTNSMSSIASGGSPDQLVKAVKKTNRSVRQVKSDFQVLRALYSRQLQTFEHFMKYSCSQIMSHIRTANLSTVKPNSSMRMKRLEVDPEEEAYQMQAQETFNDFRLLEAALHEITVDVTQRQCRVNGVEVERLASAVASSARALIELQHRYLPLEDALKDVMEKELEVIIMEERMIKEEGRNLEEAIVKCKDMTETLLSLRKLAASDANRSLVVPMVHAVSEPDKEALMENIQAITPNHEARMQSIAAAEEIYKKKRQLFMVDKVKVLARDLRNSRLQLRSVVPIHELERRRQYKLRQLYLEEKSEKEQPHQIINQQQQVINQQQQINQDVAQMALARRKELERLRDEEQRKEEKRLEEQREEQRRAEEHRAEQRREELRRAEERKEEQRRAEERRAEQRRAEQRREEQRRAELWDEQQKAEERREEQRRAERRVEEQMAEQRRAQERREDQRRMERRVSEQMAELRRAEERREEQRRAEEHREEQRRAERRAEELRAEVRRKLELEEANKTVEMRKDQQQKVAAEELLRRVTGDTSTTVKFGQVKRQSVTLDEPVKKQKNNNRAPVNHWYNSTSSGVPLRNSALIQASEQWRRSASGTQTRPKSMELLDFSTPQHIPHHHREAPIGGYPSPPNHHPPPLPQSANPTRHQTRFTDKPHNHTRMLSNPHMTAVVHPTPSQTHHNQLDSGFLSKDQHHSNRNKVLNNYPSRPPPPPPPSRREPYKTTYKNTEHGPTLYSMV